MPKVLSLKKKDDTKPQKCITQFFKTDHEDLKELPEKLQDSVKLKSSSNKKRKILSPVKKLPFCSLNGEVRFVEENPKKKCKIDDKIVTEKVLSQGNKKKCIQATSDEYVINKGHTPRKNNDLVTTKICSTNNRICNQVNEDNLNCKISPNKSYDKSNQEENCVKTSMQIISNENADNSINSTFLNHCNKSPKKSLKGINVTPKVKQISPVKSGKENSPSKFGSTVKVLEFSENQNTDDIFGDEWDLNNVEDITEDLDLSIMQRCEILSVIRQPNKIELKLKNNNNKQGTCIVEGIWVNTPLQPGEIISVLASREASRHFSVNNKCGLLVLRPDHLISSTSVVAGVFCKRKAVLQERWRGIDSANSAMTIGILIHELVQKALTHNLSTIRQLRAESDNIIKESIQMLYDAGIPETEVRTSIQMYIGPLSEFMQTYVTRERKNMNHENGKWNGKIDKVLDIEENVCCPKLGLKGKIDATLQVTVHNGGGDRSSVVPLELKSGRATGSAEHRGQLVLYGMMLSLQRQEDPATAVQKGLLLYLKERLDLREVSCGYPERHHLIMLRNELVQHVAAGPEQINSEQLLDIEDASRSLQQSLPEPVDHHNACSKCPYLTVCSLHLWHTDGPNVSESHPLSKLREESLGHLSLKHIQYFLQWCSLLKLEEKAQMTSSPLHTLWNDSVEKRAKRGVCAANLILKTVTNSDDKFLHIFDRENKNSEMSMNGKKAVKGPEEGEFSIVSIENRPWIAAGVVTVSNNNQLHILLERDLSRRLSKQTVFHIDTYESYASTVQNLTNLGVLVEDSDRALRLRKLLIDKEEPQFVPKLPREVGRLGTKLMRSLNIEQRRAVLRAIAADDYALLRGLPGTGKTQTISVLIQMLVALKRRVLVTAHTHSAVDTVLSRLPESMRVLRLGSAGRVAAAVSSRCEQKLIQNCHSTDQLAAFYDSMEVVGVTCLGATHPMLSRTTFDVCIVDEATQVLQCTVLRPLFAAHRFVLVGDPEQLPPVVRSRTARRLGMEESLFHRLMTDTATSTLRLQYRMNQALVNVANKVAYNDCLKCADQTVARATLNIDMQKISAKYSEIPWLLLACSPEFENAAIFLNVSYTKNPEHENSLANIEEACVVMKLLATLKEGGVSPSDIGIIAPYRDQVSLLRHALSKDVEVSTVDQFQGRDKSVILYSSSKLNDDGRKVKDGEVLNDQRRLAVSVTRAKHKLIVVGDFRALQKYTPLLQLIKACKTIDIDHGTVAQLNKIYSSSFT